MQCLRRHEGWSTGPACEEAAKKLVLRASSRCRHQLLQLLAEAGACSLACVSSSSKPSGKQKSLQGTTGKGSEKSAGLCLSWESEETEAGEADSCPEAPCTSVPALQPGGPSPRLQSLPCCFYHLLPPVGKRTGQVTHP